MHVHTFTLCTESLWTCSCLSWNRLAYRTQLGGQLRKSPISQQASHCVPDNMFKEQFELPLVVCDTLLTVFFSTQFRSFSVYDCLYRIDYKEYTKWGLNNMRFCWNTEVIMAHLNLCMIWWKFSEHNKAKYISDHVYIRISLENMVCEDFTTTLGVIHKEI